MTHFHAFILGIIQGLTEFIPVSSTAHLLIGQYLFNLPSGDLMFAFLVIIQLGTVLSLVVLFWEDLRGLVRAFFAPPFSSRENRLGWYIVLATLPALLFGYLLRNAVEALFQQPLQEAAIRLLVAALVLALAEYLGKRTRTLEEMTWHDALFIGLMQVFAVFPGASRSGVTIAGGMLRGFDRPSAARFAFLMAIPVMLAAGIYQTMDIIGIPGLPTFLPILGVGFATAAIVGYFAARWLLEYLSHDSLKVFALYCTAIGLLSLLVTILF